MSIPTSTRPRRLAVPAVGALALGGGVALAGTDPPRSPRQAHGRCRRP